MKNDTELFESLSWLVQEFNPGPATDGNLDPQSAAKFLVEFADLYVSMALRYFTLEPSARSLLKEDADDGSPVGEFVQAMGRALAEECARNPLGVSFFLNDGNLRFAFLFPNLDAEERELLSSLIFFASRAREVQSEQVEEHFKEKQQHFETAILPKLTAVQMAILETEEYSISDKPTA
jgi:hypothetical protein